MIISNLAVLLAERKMKVADLVRSTGINKSTLHKLYNDESVRIDFETIDKICLALDVEVGDLLVLKKNDIDQNLGQGFGHKWSQKNGLSHKFMMKMELSESDTKGQIFYK